MFSRFFIICICLCSAFASYADIADDARELIDKGMADEAIELLNSEIQINPNSKNAGTLNNLLGEAAMISKDYDLAFSAFSIAAKRGVADAHRGLGRLAFMQYDFEKATADFAKYQELKRKAKKEEDPAVETEKNVAANALQYLNRVEKIVILDSISVPRDGFFSSYKLPKASGRIIFPEDTPFPNTVAGTTAFVNEGNNYMLWAMADTTGNARLAESIRLTGGEWQHPEFTDSTINIGNMDFPFMMPDGTTLYFAAKGEQSIGGYDIFIATRDPSDNTYLQPQNLGMPYNSPYDDFMMAVDEQNNVGWWATDRNSPGGDITIYLFIPNEMRENYSVEDCDNIADKAKITDYKATWPDDADFNNILETVRAIDPNAVEKPKFYFPLGNGKAITDIEEFCSEARSLYDSYAEAMNNLEQAENELRNLRKQFHSTHSKSIAKEIISLENNREQLRTRMKNLRAKTVRAQLTH